jgi:hypothetical protein
VSGPFKALTNGGEPRSVVDEVDGRAGGQTHSPGDMLGIPFDRVWVDVGSE